jgi:hypothetical protein
MAPALLDMPVEIINAIVDELPNTWGHLMTCRHDIKQLRLVCTELESKTRRRFAQECFSSLTPMITPGGFSSAHHIMDDDTFRNSVCDIELHVGRGIGGPNDNDTDWDLTTDYIMDGIFESDFSVLVERAQLVKKVNILSPCIPSDATIEDEENINYGWQNVVMDAFAAMATPTGFQLKTFELGSNEGISTPIHLLENIPKASAIFAELTELCLYNLAEGEETEDDYDHDNEQLMPTSSTMISTRTLASFLALAPKLSKLEYIGDDAGSVRLNQIPHSLPQLPPLTEIILCSVVITEMVLIGGLKKLFKTLNRLSLENIALIFGTWRTIFSFMRKTLCLKFLDLGGLMCDEGLVTFSELLRDRPIVLDSESASSRGFTWHRAMCAEPAGGKPWSAKYKAKTRDLDEIIAENWVWVAHNTGGAEYIILDQEEGDDVMMWLAMVEEHHQLV